MKFFSIPPINHLDLMEINDRYFCLAHLCENKDYLEYFKKKSEEGKFVIIDNGAAEKSLVNTEYLLNLIKTIRPTEIIAPDILFDCDKTLEELGAFQEKWNDLEYKPDVMGVPQGDNPESYLACYLEMLHNSFVKTIGLSKISIPKSFAEITGSYSVSVNRRYLIKLLNELDLIKKPLHLLGMRNPNEYKAYKHDLIRSSDSCYTILSAINNKTLKDIQDDINETPENYFHLILTNKQLELAKLNINTLNTI